MKTSHVSTLSFHQSLVYHSISLINIVLYMLYKIFIKSYILPFLSLVLPLILNFWIKFQDDTIHFITFIYFYSLSSKDFKNIHMLCFWLPQNSWCRPCDGLFSSSLFLQIHQILYWVFPYFHSSKVSVGNTNFVVISHRSVLI